MNAPLRELEGGRIDGDAFHVSGNVSRRYGCPKPDLIETVKSVCQPRTNLLIVQERFIADEFTINDSCFEFSKVEADSLGCG